MTITVVGTGHIGSTLAGIWRRAGIPVTMASRSPQSDVDGIPVLRLDEALSSAELVVTAIPGSAMGDFLADHAPTLAEVPLIDASNNVGATVLHHAVQAGSIPYYRAFNTLGVENFREPRFDGTPADLFYSGPPSHQQSVEALIEAVGLRPVWVGDGPDAADVLDGLTRLWFTLALQQGRGRHLAFRMLP